MSSRQTGEMERGKSKFIYDYLPYNTFNHAHNHLSGRVMSIWPERDEHGKEVDLDLPENYIKSRIHRHISKWPNSEAVREQLSSDMVELVNPGGAGYHVYPNTFECSACGSVTKFDRETIRGDRGPGNPEARFVCGNCSERLSDRDQLPFVAICECGSIDELWIPQCCGVGMQFIRETTQMGNWFWRCAKPDCTEDDGSRNDRPFFSTPVYCPNSTCDNEDMEVINHTASKAFYAQTRNLINVRPDLDNLHEDNAYQARIVSDYLLSGDDVGRPSDREVQKAAADILGGPEEYFEAEDAEAERAREKAEQTLMTDVNEHRRETGVWLERDFEGDHTRLSEELYEYLSLVDDDYAPTQGLESISYQQMEDANADNTHLSLPKVREYNKLRETLNLAEVRLIKDFPITTVTYGYTRTAPEPPGEERDPATSDAEEDGRRGEDGIDADEVDEEREVELNLFHKTGEDAYSEPQLFCQQTDAEAVLVQFDKTIVLDWLETNSIITNGPNSDDEEAVRRWFLSNVIKPGRYESLPDDAPSDSRECISRHCFSLLNTTAHLFINAMGALAGHQRESLVEHLMPRSMSFVVYKRPDTDFALGSLWTLFEEQFDDFVEHIDELNDCSYDPVCSHDENGACEDCLYLATISTENVNHNLGRGTFFGGRFDGRDLIGFRDI